MRMLAFPNNSCVIYLPMTVMWYKEQWEGKLSIKCQSVLVINIITNEKIVVGLSIKHQEHNDICISEWNCKFWMLPQKI
jgi:hypothetical protein